MLDSLFIRILDMSGIGSLIILVVLLLRLCLKKAPKVISYALWGVVLVRLLCPVSIPSPVSLVPEVSSVSDTYTLAEEPISILDAGIAAYRAMGDVLNGGIDFQRVPTQRVDAQGNTEYVTATFGEVWILLGQYLWIVGAAGMVLYSFVSYRKLRKRLQVVIPVGENVYIADDIDSPFVIGVFKPRIYLPDTLGEAEQRFILMHEQHHIRRLDHIWKLLAFLALTVHWFNPLVWVAFAMASRDMEMSCDEAVIRKLGGEVRSAYAASLLSLATGRRVFAGTPLAFGEGDPKSRIRNLAKWKKPVLWITVVLVLLCGILAVCLMTDPIRKDPATTDPGRNWYFGTVEELGAGNVTEGENAGRLYLRITMADDSSMLFWLADDYVMSEEIAPGAYVSVSASAENGTGLSVTNRVELRERIGYDTLDEAIPGAILERNRSQREPEFFACASFVTLSNEAGGPAKEISHGKEPTYYTYYGLALHQLYSVRDGVLTEEAGSHIPTVLSFVWCDDGKYELTAYWQPRDGSYYSEDIRGKFPLGVYPDTQKYIHEQRAECLEQAQAHFAVEPAKPTEPEPTVESTQPEKTVANPDVLPDGIPDVVVYGTALADLPGDYTPQQAAADGCVVIIDGSVQANANIWRWFCVVISRGVQAKVRVAEYTADGVAVRIYEVSGTNGQGYVYRQLKDGAVLEQEYPWLDFDYENKAGKSPAGKQYNVYKVYALTHDPVWELSGGVPDGGVPYDDSTWEDDCIMVYCELIMLYDHPQVPKELQHAAIVENGETIYQTWDKEKLERLYSLVSEAQGYADEPKTQMMGPQLVLTGTDGTTLTAQIMLNGTMLKIDGAFYNYDPDWMKKYEVIDLLEIFAPEENLPERWLNQ